MKATLKGNVLTIEINTNDVANLPLSKTGKSKLLASTGGNTPVPMTVNGKPEVVKIGVNAFIGQ